MMLTHCIVDAEKDADMKSLSLEEAIAILSDMKVDIPVPKAAVTQIKRNVALDIAISALRCSEIPNSSDTISRQAALEVIDSVFPVDPMKSEYAQGIACGAALVKTYVEQLPSAQPEPLTDNEQRIFLAAMWREEMICKQVEDKYKDRRDPYEDSLVRICHEITRKVKGALWET